MRKILFSILLLAVVARAEVVDPAAIEAKIKSDLEALLGRVVNPQQIVLTVAAEVDRGMQRQLVEGEQLSQSPQKRMDVPPLPGFDIVGQSNKPEPPTQVRQVFRSVERVTLKKVLVQLTMDAKLGEDQHKKISSMVQAYLSSHFPSINSLSTQVADLKPVDSTDSSSFALKDYLPWISLAVALLCLLAILFSRRDRHANWREQALSTPRSIRNVEPQNILGPNSTRVVEPIAALPKSEDAATAFSGIPANAEFADHRRELLSKFLESASTFRLYFQKLEPLAQAEICKALSGPAFQTLVESLKLKVPEVGPNIAPPTEERMQFYSKNFAEFAEALVWQENQFFGFLPNLTEEQLLSLVKSQSSVVSALILKFCRPEISAVVLSKVSSELRGEIIDQFDRTREMSAEDLKVVEASVRNSVRGLPSFILGNQQEEIEYWSRILMSVENPARILSSLEQVRPDLYERLARFRFQLDDLPTLPNTLLRKVIDEVENETLAQALSTLQIDKRKYVLHLLPAARRDLLQSQIVAYEGADLHKVSSARESLTKKFREVLV